MNSWNRKNPNVHIGERRYSIVKPSVSQKMLHDVIVSSMLALISLGIHVNIWNLSRESNNFVDVPFELKTNRINGTFWCHPLTLLWKKPYKHKSNQNPSKNLKSLSAHINVYTYKFTSKSYTFFVDHHERVNGRQYNNCVYCTSNNWVNNKIILWNHREFSESLDDVMEFVEEKLVVIKSNNNNFAYIAYLCTNCTSL